MRRHFISHAALRLNSVLTGGVAAQLGVPLYWTHIVVHFQDETTAPEKKGGRPRLPLNQIQPRTSWNLGRPRCAAARRDALVMHSHALRCC